jgi:hypothetical protein
VVAIFAVFLWIVVVLTADMRTWEKKMPVNLMSHPQIAAVVSRLRRDVADACCTYYPDTLNEWSQNASTLIVDTLRERGTSEKIVWDFSKPGEVTRIVFIRDREESRWTAHGTPTFKVDSYLVQGRPYSVRIQAWDAKGKLAIDQIIEPRAH